MDYEDYIDVGCFGRRFIRRESVVNRQSIHVKGMNLDKVEQYMPVVP
jgi:hypothetical protein